MFARQRRRYFRECENWTAAKKKKEVWDSPSVRGRGNARTSEQCVNHLEIRRVLPSQNSLLSLLYVKLEANVNINPAFSIPIPNSRFVFAICKCIACLNFQWSDQIADTWLYVHCLGLLYENVFRCCASWYKRSSSIFEKKIIFFLYVMYNTDEFTLYIIVCLLLFKWKPTLKMCFYQAFSV